MVYVKRSLLNTLRSAWVPDTLIDVDVAQLPSESIQTCTGRALHLSLYLSAHGPVQTSIDVTVGGDLAVPAAPL